MFIICILGTGFFLLSRRFFSRNNDQHRMNWVNVLCVCVFECQCAKLMVYLYQFWIKVFRLLLTNYPTDRPTDQQINKIHINFFRHYFSFSISIYHHIIYIYTMWIKFTQYAMYRPLVSSISVSFFWGWKWFCCWSIPQLYLISGHIDAKYFDEFQTCCIHFSC